MNKGAFYSFGAISAVLGGLFGLLYAVAFVVIKSDLLSALFLMLGGLVGIFAMTALYRALRETDGPFALLAFSLSLGGAAGMLIHGGYDLSNALHPPASLDVDLPNPVDPRGLLTFGVAGIALLILSSLMARTPAFPSGLSVLGYVSALLMIILYVGRLIILQPTSPAILFPALVEGFIVNPIWYVWLGLALSRQK